jgi:cysteine synthase B
MDTLVLRPVSADLAQRIQSLRPFIGHTPLWPVRRLWQRPGVEVYAKIEWQQFGGSVKARPAFNIIQQAILNGNLTPDKILVDATSGNTGIAYAAICSALGIRCKLFVPSNASIERKRILASYGAELVLTDAAEGTDGAQLQCQACCNADPERYFYGDQYRNEANWQAHYTTTGPEIWDQTGGRITHFVAGLGTTGTFVGTGRRLKDYNAQIELVQLQPDHAMHALEGWKHLETTALVPSIYDAHVADRTEIVTTEGAWDFMLEAAKTEGLLLSPSAAANLMGAVAVAQQLESGVVVTVLADSADKYSEVWDELLHLGA